MPERTPYETAKARVESGDLSFEAVAGMCVAHADQLVAELKDNLAGLSAARDPFAPPTTCPVCYGDPKRVFGFGGVCPACHGTGVFIRTGIFVAHSCVRCKDGARPERCPSKVPGNCGEPTARND